MQAVTHLLVKRDAVDELHRLEVQHSTQLVRLKTQPTRW